jgi:hypothetical protein
MLDTTWKAANGVNVLQKSVTPITPFGVYLKKYADPNSNNANYGSLVPIIRMGDVYLIAAEAEDETKRPYSFGLFLHQCSEESVQG